VDRESVDDPLATPSSAVIQQELLALRRRRGISTKRLRAHAPVTCGLRSVSSYMQHRQLDPSDRPSAAYEVIKCAIDAKVLRSDMREVLMWALNYTGSPGLLKDRQIHLMSLIPEVRSADPNIPTQPLSIRAYGELEDESIWQLASALVALVESPCPPAGVPARDLVLQLSVTIREADLPWLIHAISTEPRQAIREIIQIETLGRMPVGGRVFDRIAGAQASDSMKAVALIRAAGRHAQQTVRGSLNVEGIVKEVERPASAVRYEGPPTAFKSAVRMWISSVFDRISPIDRAGRHTEALAALSASIHELESDETEQAWEQWVDVPPDASPNFV
jgi:hypothetical protein